MPFYPGAESFPHGSFPLLTFPQYTWLNYGTAVLPAYTGIIYLTVNGRLFGDLTVLDRPFDGLTVLTRPSTG